MSKPTVKQMISNKMCGNGYFILPPMSQPNYIQKIKETGGWDDLFANSCIKCPTLKGKCTCMKDKTCKTACNGETFAGCTANSNCEHTYMVHGGGDFLGTSGGALSIRDKHVKEKLDYFKQCDTIPKPMLIDAGIIDKGEEDTVTWETKQKEVYEGILSDPNAMSAAGHLSLDLPENKFTKCVNTHTEDEHIDGMLKKMKSYNEIEEEHIELIHDKLTSLMNLKKHEVDTCMKHIDNLHKCKENRGYSAHIVNGLSNMIINLISGTSLKNETPEDEAMVKRLEAEFRPKVGLVMKNLIDIAGEHEKEKCKVISGKTGILKDIHSGVKVSLNFEEIGSHLPGWNFLPEKIKGDDGGDVEITWSHLMEYGMRLGNYVMVFLIIYLFFKLILS